MGEPLTTSLVAEHGMPQEEAFAATEEADAAVGRMLVGLEAMDASRAMGWATNLQWQRLKPWG